MTRNFSPISNIVLVIIHLIIIWALAVLAYGWSLDQTEAFVSAIVGNEWSQAAALLIQLAPQMLLVAASLYTLQGNRGMARGLIIAALAINALDAFTNIVAFNEWWPSRAMALVEMGRSPEFVGATRPVGQIFAFLVTWFEEALSIALGSMLQLVADYMEAMGRRPPRFFRSGIVAAGGFDFRGVDKAAKQQQQPPANNGQQQRGKGAPGVSTQAQPVVRQAQPRRQQGNRWNA